MKPTLTRSYVQLPEMWPPEVRHEEDSVVGKAERQT
jgi:hypothetical protein